MAIKALLFDMDGLLLDTEALAIEASIWAAKDQGFDVGGELHHLMLGTTKEKSSILLKQRVPGLDLDRFWAVVDAHMQKQVEEDGIPRKQHAMELLLWAEEKGLMMGLCSGSYRQVVEPYLSMAGMIDFFTAIVAGDDDFSLGSKPAPGMYLRTAELLSVLPEECLVLEDSPNGLRSGRSAGMKTVMIPDLIPYTEDLAPFCDAVFPDLSHVPGFITEILCPSAS